MTKLSEMINLKIIQDYDNAEKFKLAKPFPHLNLNNFLNPKIAEEFLNILLKLDYYKQENDLYSFSRTEDFNNINNKKIQEIQNFFLNESLLEFLEKILGEKIQRKKVSLHSLKYEYTDYLLCHDDNVDDRKFAFILNLSKDWTHKMGGELELFEEINGVPTKIVKKIFPEFNQFNIFKVNSKSFHQVNEIITKENTRISISGWYY